MLMCCVYRGKTKLTTEAILSTKQQAVGNKKTAQRVLDV